MSSSRPDLERVNTRGRRLRSPLLLTLGTLLALEAVGGLVIFWARVTSGDTPGESVHVLAGIALTAIYAVYQWRHWKRVAPFRPGLHYTIGLLAAISMVLANATGLALGALWFRARLGAAPGGPVEYPPFLSAVHNIGSMLVLTFVGGHLGAVLLRDRETFGRAAN